MVHHLLGRLFKQRFSLCFFEETLERVHASVVGQGAQSVRARDLAEPRRRHPERARIFNCQSGSALRGIFRRLAHARGAGGDGVGVSVSVGAAMVSVPRPAWAKSSPARFRTTSGPP